MKVSNWGNYPVTEATVHSFSGSGEALREIDALEGYIPRGLGRCYGDSALATNIVSTLRHNRFLSFDTQNGVLACEAGCSFADILDVIVPKGWFLPVTPGTKFVTLGGAIAADVHGKNHHSEGSFSRHLLSFVLLTPNGEILRCSPTEHPEVFEATCGGMGLTGLILEATFRLKKIETAYIVEDSIRIRNIDELFSHFEAAQRFTYSVAWVDCLAKGKSLGKGVLFNGEHATRADLKGHRAAATPLQPAKHLNLPIPFFFPGFVLNPLTIKLFNIFYFRFKSRRKPLRHIVDYESYFYPLDAIQGWNKVYGKRGFAQYQFVIPPDKGYEGMKRILGMISEARMPSFLTVLKYFGPQDGMISFPMEGYTLALDFPITPKLFPFFDRLDKVVLEYGGRLYLTKDSRMSAEMMMKGYPRLPEFREIREQLDPEGRLGSLQSARVGL